MTSWLATEADIPALVEMGRRFHAMSPHKTIGEFDPCASANVLNFLISDPRGLVLMNETGAIGGVLVPVFFSPAKLLMEISFWHVPKSGRSMLSLFEAEARAKGAHGCHLSIFVDGREASAARFLGAMGYRPIEHRFMKEF